MSLDRRTALQLTGTAGLTALAGCSSLAGLFSSGPTYEYALTVDAADESLRDHVLYEPDDSEPFVEGARTALEAVLPDGRHTTYGYEPVPADAYVAHEDRYYQTKVVVTGREEKRRSLVRIDPVDGDDVPDDARAVGSLPRASARAVGVLHEHGTRRDVAGEASTDLRHGAYVLRRPAEVNGPLADELDGTVVRMDGGSERAYRISVTDETVTETVYTAFAVEVAGDRSTFREVALATRVDADPTTESLDRDVRNLLEDAIETGRYSEETPLSIRFSTLLERLDLGDVTVGENGLFMWYGESLYRYGLYVHPVE